MAIEKGNIDIIKLLLSNEKIDVNRQSIILMNFILLNFSQLVLMIF